MSNKITYQDDGLRSYMQQQSDDDLREAYRIFSTKTSNDPEEQQAFRNTAQMALSILKIRGKR